MARPKTSFSKDDLIAIAIDSAKPLEARRIAAGMLYLLGVRDEQDRQARATMARLGIADATPTKEIGT